MDTEGLFPIEQFPGPSSPRDNISSLINLELQRAGDSPHSEMSNIESFSKFLQVIYSHDN